MSSTSGTQVGGKRLREQLPLTLMADHRRTKNVSCNYINRIVRDRVYIRLDRISAFTLRGAKYIRNIHVVRVDTWATALRKYIKKTRQRYNFEERNSISSLLFLVEREIKIAIKIKIVIETMDEAIRLCLFSQWATAENDCDSNVPLQNGYTLFNSRG